MKNFPRICVIPFLLLLSIGIGSFLPKTEPLDVRYLSKAVSISIKGTSSLHDWEMKSSEGTCEAEFAIGKSTTITSLKRLSFIIPSKSLKSGHKVMDKNTYKALKTNEHANIGFVLSNSKVKKIDESTYEVQCFGKLTIAGTTLETELLANGKLNATDHSITFSGTKKMKMTDYNVKPPTVMMGTIKTGDEISVTYNLILTY